MGLAFLISVFFGIAAIMTYKKISQKDTPFSTFCSIETEKNETLLWVLPLFLFAVFRILLAALTEGHPADMSCWAAWGTRLFRTGPENFYAADYFCDYPPGYLYILGFLAGVSDLFHLSDGAFSLLLKMPAILSELLLALFFFQVGKRYWSTKNALYLSAFFLLAPIFWFDSSVWGQIDSVLLLFLTLSLWKLSQKNYTPAILLYVLAVLIKPQGLILAPVYCLAVLESGSIKKILSACISGILLFILCTIPFAPTWQNHTGFLGFLYALNPLWVLEKYLETLASYPYFTVNAFNFYGLLGLNWVSLPSDSAIVSILHISILALGVLGAVFLLFKIKKPTSRLFLSAYFLFGFLFTFAFKMHERYIVLPVLFLFIEFLISKNKKIFCVFSSLSCVGFLNIYYVLQLASTSNIAPDYRLVSVLSFLEVALFLYSLWVIYKDYILSFVKIRERKDRKISSFVLSLLKIANGSESKKKERKMLRTDYWILSLILLLYSGIAFVNLGDKSAPETYYTPEKVNETFMVHFSEPVTISEVNYYCGIGDVDGDTGIVFSASSDGTAWTNLQYPLCPLESVFSWKTQTIEPLENIKYLQGRFLSTEYTLFEMGFRNPEGVLLSYEKITGENPAGLSCMMDEQRLVTNAPSYLNSTYFDEIYHPRTAYEHLHFMPYYETTHPPLGKLMMSLGILCFGMNPFGWRFTGTLMGILMLPSFYLFVKRLFGRTRYATIGTLLFAFDFMHFSLTRIGTIDSYPVFFILCMYYFMYRFGELAVDWARERKCSGKKQLLYLFLSGLFMGLGCASKWTAVYGAAGLAIEFAFILYRVWYLLPLEDKKSFLPFLTKTCAWCIPFFIIIPAGIYTLSYLPISMVDGYGNVFEVMWENQKYMLSYHGKLNGTHPYSSKWYTWPFVYKPMWAYQAPPETIPANQIGCISIFQNPLLSWAGIAAFFYTLYLGWKKHDFRIWFLFIALLAQYLPWMFVQRYALQYHFFGTLPFLILFVIYAMEALEERFKNFGYLSTLFTLFCLLLFIAFYPVLSGVPISRFYAETFLTWFPSWVFFI